jgi:MFS transporter, DHA1 family, multidrug resistance protein
VTQPSPSATTTREAHAPTGAAYYGLAAILGALTGMGPLAIDTYLPALPTIARELATGMPTVQVSLSIYFVGIALGQALYGPLSDRVGRKPALYIGLLLFIAGSLGCALAPGVRPLIAFRFVQALGGCAPLVVPRAVVRDLFDARGSVRMLSVLMLVMGLAPILSPLLGGQLLVHFGWRSIFWVHASIGSALLLTVFLCLRESLPAERRVRQPVSAVLATYASLLRDRTYMGYVLSGSFTFAGLLAYISGSAFVFIELFHVPPERFGFYFGTNAFGIIACSQINRALARTHDARGILNRVLYLTLASSVLLVADAFTGFGGFAGLLVPLFFFIAVHGFVSPNSTALAMAPHGRVAGTASALMGTVQFVLGATAGSLISAFADGTARPFAAVVGGCGVLAFLMNAGIRSLESGFRADRGIRSGRALNPDS